MSHTVPNLLTIPILSHKSLRMGVTTEAEEFQQNASVLCCVKAIYATKTARKTSHSSGPFQFSTRKSLYPTYSSPVACTHRKVIRHMTSDFDVCEVDVNMQMSFLNAVLFLAPPPPPQTVVLRCKNGLLFVSYRDYGVSHCARDVKGGGGVGCQCIECSSRQG